jgi:hypothetical protein
VSDRHLPVRPSLDQLKHQAKDLLRDMKRERADAKLSEAQFALARSYGVASWPRLVLACRLIDAIWRNHVGVVRTLVTKHPNLLHEMARATASCNWGPPMSYAANVGRDEIITMLHDLGAKDITHALGRALLQGKLETARLLEKLGARVPRDAAIGCAEAQKDSGLAHVLSLGGDLGDERHPLAAVAMLLETYTRNPEGKHGCLELFATHGVQLPDTPPMAVHRGRIDLLEDHLRRDPDLLTRTFSHQEIYPPALGCHADETLAGHGTPLAGSTLLHMCVDYDEMEIARWLLDHGMPVDTRAAVDRDGFGGHTALFGCVVSYPHLNRRQKDAAFARLLLDRGADPNVRASLRKALRFTADESLHEYPDITPLAWGRRFHGRELVSEVAMRLIAERGGHP